MKKALAERRKNPPKRGRKGRKRKRRNWPGLIIFCEISILRQFNSKGKEAIRSMLALNLNLASSPSMKSDVKVSVRALCYICRHLKVALAAVEGGSYI